MGYGIGLENENLAAEKLAADGIEKLIICPFTLATNGTITVFTVCIQI
ncbi:hypothetical protein IE5_02218 [Bacillus cereus BAG3X2-2]|nr:hypothetical protein [Bacillus cereus]EJQ21170.1 hypothetical protein IE5_02218 [Bacillus cereus BAG3X2-2]